MEETQPWIAAPPPRYPETNIFRGSHKRPAAYLWIARPSRLRSSAALIRWTPETNKTSFQSPKTEQLRQLLQSGRRRRACALASVRRSNCKCGFPACSFREDSAMPGC